MLKNINYTVLILFILTIKKYINLTFFMLKNINK